MSEPDTDKQARVEAFLNDARAQTEKEMERRKAAADGRVITLEATKVKRDVPVVSVPADVAPAVTPGTDPAPTKNVRNALRTPQEPFGHPGHFAKHTTGDR